MIIHRKRRMLMLLVAFPVFFCLSSLLFPALAAKARDPLPSGVGPGGTAGALSVSGKAAQTQPRVVTRKGDLIIVSKEFVDAVRKDNSIILSTVAVKAMVDDEGRILGFQLFQLDRGSIPEQMGFKAKDILASVNGIPARELEAMQGSLENKQRFELTILRNGKEKRVQVVVR